MMRDMENRMIRNIAGITREEFEAIEFFLKVKKHCHNINNHDHSMCLNENHEHREDSTKECRCALTWCPRLGGSYRGIPTKF